MQFVLHCQAQTTPKARHTSAASAAFLRASSCCDVLPPVPVPGALPPSVRGGPPTLRGTEDVPVFGGGAESRVRPGCAKASGDDSLPQRLPIVVKS
jgi:hypothetical protein